MSACVFCAIARGELSAHKVHEDDLVTAFLDRGPIRPGHVQIIPRAHIEVFDDLPPPVGTRILEIGQRLAKAMKRTYHVDRVAFVFSGGDIDHAHAHVVPLIDKTDITSRRYIQEQTLTFRPMPTPPDNELAAWANRLRTLLAGDA